MCTSLRTLMVLVGLLLPATAMAQKEGDIQAQAQILEFLPNGGILVHIFATTKEGCETEKENGREAIQFNTDPGHIVSVSPAIPAANVDNLAILEEQYDWTQGCIVIFSTRPVGQESRSPTARG